MSDHRIPELMKAIETANIKADNNKKLMAFMMAKLMFTKADFTTFKDDAGIITNELDKLND